MHFFICFQDCLEKKSAIAIKGEERQNYIKEKGENYKHDLSLMFYIKMKFL